MGYFCRPLTLSHGGSGIRHQGAQTPYSALFFFSRLFAAKKKDSARNSALEVEGKKPPIGFSPESRGSTVVVVVVVVMSFDWVDVFPCFPEKGWLCLPTFDVILLVKGLVGCQVVGRCGGQERVGGRDRGPRADKKVVEWVIFFCARHFDRDTERGLGYCYCHSGTNTQKMPMPNAICRYAQKENRGREKETER